MANAGRVAIVPKGDWSAAVEYKRLDAVAYNNTLYIAKKAVPAGTGTTNTEYWMKCVVGGAGSIATTEDAGTVKAGVDIGVDSTGEMILKTDFTEQSDLTELTGTEDRQTFFGKIAKAVSTLISHISLGATADKAGHVKLSNSSAVTDSTGLALPATEKNAALDGTMANQIATLNKSLSAKADKDGLLIVQRKDLPATTYPANSDKNVSVTLTVPSGYTALTYLNYAVSDGSLSVRGYSLSGKILTLSVNNRSPQAVTSAISTFFLCVKS